jgi:hypothetical protein
MRGIHNQVLKAMCIDKLFLLNELTDRRLQIIEIGNVNCFHIRKTNLRCGFRVPRLLLKASLNGLIKNSLSRS